MQIVNKLSSTEFRKARSCPLGKYSNVSYATGKEMVELAKCNSSFSAAGDLAVSFDKQTSSGKSWKQFHSSNIFEIKNTFRDKNATLTSPKFKFYEIHLF